MSVILVSGALANKPHNGGAAWTRLSWALGLKALGFEVAFVEQIRRDRCVDAVGPALHLRGVGQPAVLPARDGTIRPLRSGDIDLRRWSISRPDSIRAG